MTMLQWEADWEPIDRRLGIPSDDGLLRARAEAMDRAHADQSRVVAADHRYLALLGERHVARVLGLPMDLTVKPYGSRRVNFRIGAPRKDGKPKWRVDVVSARVLRNGADPDLRRSLAPKTPTVDIMVLVIFDPDLAFPRLAGWCWEKHLLATGREAQFREGFPNKVLAAWELSPPWELAALVDPGSPFADPGNWQSPPPEPTPFVGLAIRRVEPGPEQLGLF